MEELADYVKGYKDILDIPKPQRFLKRPSLEQLFTRKVMRDVQKRTDAIEDAVKNYGYRQREIADHLGMHFSSISRILGQVSKMTRKET